LAIAALTVLLAAAAPAIAQQRVLGVDISYWNTGSNQAPGSVGISQANWDTGFSTGNRKFAFIRASRGGTTGVDQPAGTPGGGSLSTLSRRYDDPRFVQNISRATAAGMLAGPYHYGRLDIVANWPSPGQIANNGTDEANHFIEMAGAWMRPGYLMPMFDLEDGQNEITPDNPDGTPGRTANDGAQFSLDFSNRIYAVMGIRPAIYTSGTYSSWLQGASSTLRNQLAQPVANSPSVTGPAFPMLWNPRYAYQGQEGDPGIQTANPKDTASTFYGPWDDYGVAHPWQFWQYSSTSSIPGFNAVDAGIDSNVSHGDIEYVRNYLVPAIWWDNSSGDWSSLANWNSGQAPVAPIQAPGQATPFQTGSLPTPRLPGAAGSGPTSGQYDTVILERPNANITITVSTGTHNIRKLYMRETLNINGGSLTINYDPTYRLDNSSTVLHGGPLSAQFSGPVTLGGSGSLSVHTLQVDATRTFTVGNGNLAFNRINLMPGTTPAKILMNGDVNIMPLANAAATIATGAGPGTSGRIDLGGASRNFNVADGSAAVDVSIGVPIINGGLIKSGPGAMALTAANTYAGDTAVQAGSLRLATTSLANAADVYLTTGATLDLTFGAGVPDVIDSLFIDGVSQPAGIWGAVGSGAPLTSPLIAGTGRLQVTTFIAPIAGDFNGDGTVDQADLTAWQNGFGMPTGAEVEHGDGDGDADVDGSDFLVWQQNLGSAQGVSAAAANAAAVPEPRTVVLMLASLAALAVRSRR
jgi:autotransporter-associated beta strand protein